jgi:hypothetical protein
MTRYVLAPTLGPSDKFDPLPRGDEQIHRFDILPAAHLALGIGTGSRNSALAQLKKAGGVPSGVGLELLLLASLISIADTKINRVRASQDGWTREIGLYLPVQDSTRWALAKPVLERMLRFLNRRYLGDRFQSLGGQPWQAIHLKKHCSLRNLKRFLCFRAGWTVSSARSINWKQTKRTSTSSATRQMAL